MERLKELQKDVGLEFEQLQSTKEKVLSSMSKRHKELDDALNRLSINLNENYKPSEDIDTNRVSTNLDEIYKTLEEIDKQTEELDNILDGLLLS